MRIHLAAIGWLPDAPAGNRLRWSYPADAIVKGDPLGFPEKLIVERAPLDVNLPRPGGQTVATWSAAAPEASPIPLEWWDEVGTVSLGGSLPLVYDLPSPAQAVRFTYRGPAAAVVALDHSRDERLVVRGLTDGQFFYLEDSRIDRLEVFATAARLENFATVDLFADRGLDWTPVATIGVAATAHATLDQVAPRYLSAPTMTPTEWQELTKQANEALAAGPGSGPDEGPTPWQAFGFALAMRWEFALLFGHGFFDGPRIKTSSLDEIHEAALLHGPPPGPVAYRVREAAGRVEASNLAVCPPWMAAPLSKPGQPGYVSPRVGLNPDGGFTAVFGFEWQQTDPRAIGIELEEVVGKSAATNKGPSTHRLQLRDRTPMQGACARSLPVPFHDVTLEGRVRAVDGWDRESVWSKPSPAVTLQLTHEPPAPPLASAVHTGTEVRVRRTAGTGGADSWTPDVIVEKAGGTVGLYRRTSAPRAEDATAEEPAFAGGQRYRVRIPAVASAGDFAGGRLIAAGCSFAIESVQGDEFVFTVPDPGEAAGASLFPAGPVSLRQDPLVPALWTELGEFPAVGLPTELVASDPVPPPTDAAEVLSYLVRVKCLGHVGPPGNVVQAVLRPAAPDVPPPFEVEPLGLDFYDRTLVRVRFTDPVAGGSYSVWWADGDAPGPQFADRAVPGEYGAQTPFDSRVLFDVLSLPVPRQVDRTVTIGVQGVNGGHGGSEFKTVKLVLQPPIP